MPTQKRFWDNPYMTDLDTTITHVHANDIGVAETIFYAFSGGQESDAGTMGGLSVLEARQVDKDILYTLPANHEFAVGDSVRMSIDWERRYKLMRLHFAAEIILELVYQHVPDIVKIGAHIAEDKSRVDFEWTQNISTLFASLNTQAHNLIEANHAITSAFSDEENQRRYWEIEGFARVACGGTHLKTTGEVGTLALKRKNVGKDKERIEIVLVEQRT